MPTASRLLRGILLLALLIIPGTALAHDENGNPTPDDDPEQAVLPSSGYTGPSSLPYLSFYEGAWLYGQFQEKRLSDQIPSHVRGDGDWLVWEDARRSEIFLYSVSANDGFYLTSDRAVQRNPEISGSTIVWEDYRDGRQAQIYSYNMDTGITKRLSTGGGNNRNPSIDANIVAWETDRSGNQDIYGIRLNNGTEFPIQSGTDRETDPHVLDGQVYYRTYRFNLWDIMGHDVHENRTYAVTSDLAINGVPFDNGQNLLFLTQTQTAWVLTGYDAKDDRVRATGIRFSDTARTPASGDHLIQLARDVGKSQVVARNITTGATNHITAGLNLLTDPHLDGNTVFLILATKNGTSLITLQISDFAFSARPKLDVISPNTGTRWINTITARGTLQAGSTWTAPQTFTYRIDNKAPNLIIADRQWSFSLDPTGLEPGTHMVTITATYLEGPPVQSTITLTIPGTTKGLDISSLGEQAHKARLAGAYTNYIGNNPASWLIIPLIIIVLVLATIRIIIAIRHNRNPTTVEYVRPR